MRLENRKFLLLVTGVAICMPLAATASDPPEQPITATAGNDWIFQTVPEYSSLSPAVEPGQENASGTGPGHFAFPVSERSVNAWRHQGQWLTERLAARDLRLGDAAHIRIFKQSRELELHLKGRDGFELYRVFPICEMSGSLGPKRFEGDLQAPEGFYSIRSERLHAHSDFHLAFNLGFPNNYDRSLDRTGSNIMIHGGCASNGCFAMTDYYMEQLWLFAETALRGGQQSIGVEIYPFRMTEANLAAHASSRWIDFWRSLKSLHDHFLETGLPAPVSNLDGRYVLTTPDVELAAPAITAAAIREADQERLPVVPSAP